MGVEGLAEIRQSYEFALDHIGQDVRSGPVWQDYIQFLAAPKPGLPEHDALYGAAPEGQEDSQRTAALRRAYHRALLVPNAALDALWTGYERFENGTGNKQLSKRALDEWRPRFQAARGLVKDRTSKVEPLDLRALPLPPGRGGARRAQQAAAWRKYLEWERSNLQELDPGSYQTRVILAYEQALAILLLYPDVWLDFASWHSIGGGAGTAAAKDVLHRGRKVLPSAISLHFAAAEAEEAAGAIDKAKEVYEELVEKLTAGTLVNKKQEKSAADGENQDSAAPAPPAPLLGPKAGTLVWIHYMRFARRSNGMMAARKLFLRARKYPALCWEAFAASAAMEWATEGKDQIPRNIYELGLKTYLSEPEYVLTYADFLQGLGDVANARSLFERALTATPVEGVGPLFDAYIQLESASGSLAAVATLEQRRRDVLGATVVNNALDAAHVAQLKYNYMGLSSGLEIGLAQAGVVPAISFLPRGPSATTGATGGESDGGGNGDGGGGGDRRRSTRRRGRSRSRSRSPPAGRRASSPTGGDSEQPIRHFPRELGLLVNLVRGPPDGPVPDNEKIIDVIMRMDFSPEGIEAHELNAARERKRQRRTAQGEPGGDGGGFGGGGGGGKRKAEHGLQPPQMIDSESGESSDDDDGEGAGLDVYRRRMRSRV
jgi:cleavage stimulation factor subunit 3